MLESFRSVRQLHGASQPINMPLCKAELSKQQHVLHQITMARKAIQKKHKMLKSGKEDTEYRMKEVFKPIVN